MKKRRGKHKRGKKGAIEDEVNLAKKPNMKAGDGTNNNDGKVEESGTNFFLKDIKGMLSCVQATLNDIQHENRKMADSFPSAFKKYNYIPQEVSQQGNKGKQCYETRVTSTEREI